MKYIKLIFIFCLFIPLKSYTQSTITVGDGGNFPTLSQAASSLNPGDVVVILNQVFSNGPQYLTNINGLPNQPITIVGQTNQGPTFSGGSEAIHLSNCNHIIIDGLVFEQQTENSLSIDDGGSYASPSTNITVKNCVFRDMGANGNQDFLKMAGVDDFSVINCTFTNGVSSGPGSGVDMVGCHQGFIQDCVFDNPGSMGVSAKGGTQYITIERNVFKNVRERGVAVGGSTGLSFFRPPLPNPIVGAFEASDINVFSNVFINDHAPIAFVGAVNSTFRNNTIYKPQNWVMRILQENTNDGFLPCSDNEFSNNIIYLQNDLLEVNTGSNTDAGSFTFSHNAWYNESSSNWSPDLPASSQNQLISNPLFTNPANGDFTLSNQSPCIGNGLSGAAPTRDFNQTPYSNPPSRGAFESSQGNDANSLSWTTTPTSISNGNNQFTLDYSIDQAGILVIHTYDSNWQQTGQVFEEVSPGTRQSTLTLTANGVSTENNHIEVQLLSSSWGDIGVQYLSVDVSSGSTPPPPPPTPTNSLSWTTTPTSISNGNNQFTLDYSIDQAGILVIHTYDSNWQQTGQVFEEVSPGTRQTTLTLVANGVSTENNHIEVQLLSSSWGDIGVQYLSENVPSGITPPPPPPPSGNSLSWTTTPTSISNGNNQFTLDYSIDQAGILVIHAYDSNWQQTGQVFEEVSPGTRQTTLTLVANGVSTENNHIEVQLLSSSWGDIGVQYLSVDVSSGSTPPPPPPTPTNSLSWTTTPTSISNGDNQVALNYSLDQSGVIVVQLYSGSNYIGQVYKNVSAGTGQSTLTLNANGLSSGNYRLTAELRDSGWTAIDGTQLSQEVPFSGTPPPPTPTNSLSWITTPTSVSNGNNEFALNYSIDQAGILVIHTYNSDWQETGQVFEEVSPGTRQSTLTLTANGVSAENNHIEVQLLSSSWGDIGVQYLSVDVPSGSTPPPTSGTCDCPDPAEPGNTVTVSNVSQLRAALDQANNQNGNMTIKVEPGEYQVDYPLVIRPTTSNLSIMGTTGNREDVFIKGQGYDGAVTVVLLVQADNFTLAHLTVGESSTHAIQLQGEQDADNFTAINVRLVDVYEQILKVSMGPDSYSDNGRILCSEFEFTAGEAYNDYTRAIDALKCRNWIVSNNVIKGIRSPNNEIAEHSILFWRASEGTIVTNNKIMNCDRGIGFGLGNRDEDGHIGGLIMNNFVHTNRDVGIGIEHSPNTKIYNNTVITDNYPRSIEYRFSATTNVQIINNIVSGAISDRSSGSSGNVNNNYTVSNLNVFADAANHDYHLAGTPSGIVDAGTSLSEVTTDIDCDNRISGAGMDIGADEVTRAFKEEVSGLLSVSLYPNPANYSVQLDCEMSEDTQAQIQVYDNLGQLVKNISNIELYEGTQTLNVDVSDLPVGMYFCALQSNEWQTVKKFVIAR